MKFSSPHTASVTRIREGLSSTLQLPFAFLCAHGGPSVIALIIAAAALFGLASCGESIETPDDMLPFLSDPENGLVRERGGRPVLWRVKYLPNDYLAWRYLQSLDGYDGAARDSAMKSYANTICFVLTVAPGEKNGGDVMMQGVGSFDDFQARAMQLNFDVKDLVKLRYGGTETPAVISTMENTYGMSEGRDIMVIFAKDEARWNSTDTLDVELDDRIFSSGIHHFAFTMEDIGKVPKPDIPASH